MHGIAGVQEVRWRALSLTTITDTRGSLTLVEADQHLPFSIDRVFFLHGVQPGQRRAGHAHKTLEEILVAVAGSFEVTCDDGRTRRRYRLDRPDEGLHIASRVWIELDNFAPGTVCLALASAPYDPADQWRDYDEFVADAAAGP